MNKTEMETDDTIDISAVRDCDKLEFIEHRLSLLSNELSEVIDCKYSKHSLKYRTEIREHIRKTKRKVREFINHIKER